ncbi:hypothetical protein Ssi02_01830 [Sinosporangium siamense]|uniref:Uncharacterized protein n=1 Tax=Sinosporangium siamense TaxID=1367973 RepID=A0A919RAI4_9ACTN|nr:hypothetical protein Ssi02_01830 [Sinosporangium siamense]
MPGKLRLKLGRPPWCRPLYRQPRWLGEAGCGDQGGSARCLGNPGGTVPAVRVVGVAQWAVLAPAVPAARASQRGLSAIGVDQSGVSVMCGLGWVAVGAPLN